MYVYKKHIVSKLISTPKKITMKKIHPENYLETAGKFTPGISRLRSRTVSDLKINPTNTGLDQAQEQFNVLIIKKAWNCHSPHPSSQHQVTSLRGVSGMLPGLFIAICKLDACVRMSILNISV